MLIIINSSCKRALKRKITSFLFHNSGTPRSHSSTKKSSIAHIMLWPVDRFKNRLWRSCSVSGQRFVRRPTLRKEDMECFPCMSQCVLHVDMSKCVCCMSLCVCCMSTCYACRHVMHVTVCVLHVDILCMSLRVCCMLTCYACHCVCAACRNVVHFTVCECCFKLQNLHL